jgi:glycoprotein endo-alpha-1,2-mannosidase
MFRLQWPLYTIVVLAALTIFEVHSSSASLLPPSVHAFFYIWYGTPAHDGKYLHWDHEVLPHWETRINEAYPTVGTRHYPPSNLHSPYYPLQNPYSSRDKSNLLRQFTSMRDAGISVAVISWWGRASSIHSSDTQGVATDRIMHDIFQAADENGVIKLAFHLEPYPTRSVESVRDDIAYILENYGNYTSLYRASDGRHLYYVYDSYHIFPSQWARLLSKDGDITVRGTELDGIFLGT